MRFNYKKVAAIGASVLLTGMTLGVAAAANFPTPYSSGSSSGTAVVSGTGAGVDDTVATSSIANYLAGQVTGILSIPEGSWQVMTSSDDLELSESIANVETYIDDGDLSLLTDGTFSNEKGDAKYEQFLYFDDTTSSSVVYTEDDDSNIGLFFKINDGAVIARYVMDFTTNLKSDIETDQELSDIEDKDITFLGKTYTVTTANNGTNIALVLMSGASKATINNDETLTIGGREVSALVSSSTEVRFTVDGESLDKMNKGETTKLADGSYLGVTDITYQNFAGGLMQATFHLGADKLELTDGSSLTVNGETIGEAAVTITSTESGGDITISQIAINMTAEDDLYVGEGKKLSQAPNLDEPEVLFSQNWDIEFNGLEDINTEEVTLKSSNSKKQYKLKFNNYNGDSIELPVVYFTSSGLKGGLYDTADKDLLVLNASTTITDEDYFVLNTADPTLYGSDARSFVVRYRGSDKVTDTDPKVTFDISGVETGRTVTLASDGTFNIKVGGSTFNFANDSSGASNNFNITLTDTQLGFVNDTAGWMQMRTQYNALVTINNTDLSDATSSWIVSVDVDDIDKDGDEVGLGTAQNVFAVTLTNSTTSTIEITTGAVTSSSSFLTNPDNDDETMVRTTYGAYVSVIDTSTAPVQVTATIPESIVKPLIYVTSGSVATSTAGGSMVFTDAEKTSWQSRNVVLVGGSCINSATATALGVTYPVCGADFTSATGVGSGEYMIKSVGDAFTTGKIALVVAGYAKADTAAAASKLVNNPGDVDTTAGKEYRGKTGVTGSLAFAEV